MSDFVQLRRDAIAAAIVVTVAVTVLMAKPRDTQTGKPNPPARPQFGVMVERPSPFEIARHGETDIETQVAPASDMPESQSEEASNEAPVESKAENKSAATSAKVEEEQPENDASVALNSSIKIDTDEMEKVDTEQTEKDEPAIEEAEPKPASNPFETRMRPVAEMMDFEVRTKLDVYQRVMSAGEVSVYLYMDKVASEEELRDMVNLYVLRTDTAQVEIQRDGTYKLFGETPTSGLLCELPSEGKWHPNWRTAALNILGSIPDKNARTMLVVTTPKAELAIYRALATRLGDKPRPGTELLVEARSGPAGKVTFHFVGERPSSTNRKGIAP